MSSKIFSPFTPDRYVDEYARVSQLVRILPWDAGRANRIVTSAREVMLSAASRPIQMGAIDQFLQQYGLETSEGVGLVALAEALLRVPDDQTADLLIRDKILSGAWMASPRATRDLLVNASRVGLTATKMTLQGFFARVGTPVIRRAFRLGIRRMGRQFVLGETIDQATLHARSLVAQGYALSFDMLGEGARTLADAEKYMGHYVEALAAIARARQQGRLTTGRDGISVKLSALHPRYHPLQKEICRPVLRDRLLQLAQLAKAHDLTLTVDAEETERLTLSLQIIADVAHDPSLQGWNGFGLAVQAYQKYAPELIDHVIQMARSSGHVLRVRLVKGAYWDTEIKRAQVMGLPDYPVWTRKCNTDLSYLVCAQKLLSARDVVYPMFATHNAHTMIAVLDLAAGVRTGFEFQRLYGMGTALHDVMKEQMDVLSTVYAPVGTHQDLLAYLVRRLLENGANTSFIHQAAGQQENQSLSGSEGSVVYDDPVARAIQHTTRRHRDLPLPARLYGHWQNSYGVDLAQTAEREAFLARGRRDFTVPIFDMRGATAVEVDQAMVRARGAFLVWNQTPIVQRAAVLEKFADLMEQSTGVLADALIDEGFKTLMDVQAEIREAVEFARYYAMLARQTFDESGLAMPGPTGESNILTWTGRGVFACISPWNFPLAIFVGQVVAALVAGNSVIAKPAEQTPRVAVLAVELLYQAGIPRDVLHLMIGDGTVGGILTAHPDLAGVAFTGSTEVARLINRTLAAKEGPIVPLIAETGGQNAMIVDATALPEQVVDDIILSAFGSAGQRCSALRVLYLQDDIADKILAMLAGALHMLRVGDPHDPSTDVGPVIDHAAYGRLVDHQAFLQTIGARLVAQAPLAQHLSPPYFAPVIYEINSIRQLPGEVFGPILHVVRFQASDLSRVVDDVNATGYGLTFGLHTRLDSRMARLSRDVRVGNVYINRSQIGAVVGVQPFGGQGLSGTGPKAGGPHYLYRFATEKIVTRNTAASGGNIALVAGSD